MYKNEPRWLIAPPEKNLQVPFVKGTPSKILQNDQMQYEIDTFKGKTTIVANVRDTMQFSNRKKDQTYQDMCLMNVLNEPEILRNLIERYKLDEIFTYIGPTLIVVNPYKPIERHFDKQMIDKVRARILNGDMKGDPHVYMIAGKAYQGLKYEQRKQAIVISGESGAGKTQSTKYCMKMITSLSHKQSQSIQNKILACNPLLEAFGNSKTVRNDNSSRFGKYVQIFFDRDNTIKGANIINYLLQKSRVVSISPNERTYHAFYALTASRAYGTKSPSSYNYLKQSNCYDAANIDDAKYFKDINSSMDEIGFSKDEQQKIWTLVGAILELGNIEFDDKRHQTNESNPCQIINKVELPKISKTIGITPQALQKLLVYEKKIILKETSFKPYSKLGCIGNCNTLSKALYNAIFEFIIYKIQLVLNPHAKQTLNSINILDIFGFQNFKSNSLEQLCINFTNQKLLKQYNKYVFQNEMVILKQDGLEKEIQNIKPPTNDDVISLLSDKLSLFAIINEYTPNPQFKDQDMMHGFQRDFTKSKLLKFDLLNKNNFMVIHSQCEVTYNIEGFKLKNQDKVNAQIEQIYRKLFVNQNKNQTGKTLLAKFSKEIEDLVTQLSTASNHFIRCIKPNEQKKPQKVQQIYQLAQIRYLGVFETIQIRQKTFPSRKFYDQFIQNYQQVFQGSKGKKGKEAVLSIMGEAGAKPKDYLLGIKRVYMNQQLEDTLNKALFMFLKVKRQMATKIQKQYRVFIFRKKIFANLKIFVKRKNLWIKFQAKIRRDILRQAYKSICVYAETKNAIQKEEKMKQIQNKRDANYGSMTKQMKEKIQKIQKKEEGHKQSSANLNVDLKDIMRPSAQQSKQLDESTVMDKDQKPYKRLLRRNQTQVQKQQGQFNQSFRQGDSIYVTSNPDVVFEKNITLDLYDKNSKQGNLQKLQKILAQQYKLQINGNEQEFFSPNSEDCTFQIQDTPPDYQNKIVHFDADQFFKKVLRKRTNFIGMSKDYKDVLIAKNRPMSKSLTVIDEEDEDKALKVFKVVVRVGEQAKLDNVFRLIENMIALCQSTSQQLKNQVFLQLIKQSNTTHELASIRIYQSMAVFLHIYIPDQDFIMAGLHLFYRKLQDQKNSEKEQQYLRYLFKKMLRRIQNPPVIGYMPIKYQMMALMCKRQISVPVYLPVGNSILIRVESYDTFSDIKERVIRQFGINSMRIRPEMFRFFEIVNFQNEELQESPLNENQIVWDIMTYWQLAKQKYKEANSPPPAFFLMLKVVFAFEIYPDDSEAIELGFAQCYFDYFIGRIRVDFSQMAALAACVKKIKLPNRPQTEVLGSFPIWMAKKFSKQELADAMVQNVKQMEAEGLNVLRMKFRFLQICNDCPLAMAMAIPTEQAIKLYFKPKKIYLTDKCEIKEEFSMRTIEKWAIDKEKFVFDIKGGKMKTQAIFTEYAFSCSQFLSDLPKMLKRSSK